MTLVWRDYDQATLDYECNPSVMIGNQDQYLKLYAERSSATRARRPDMIVGRYGDDPLQAINIYPAVRPQAALHVFVHGGGWRMLTKDDSDFVVDGLGDDATVAAISYRLLPAVALAEVVADVRVALAWMWRHAADYAADPARLFLSGHSAGGHLAAMVLAPGWQQAHGMPEDAVKGALLLSGNYDLEPLRLSYRNAWLHLDDASMQVLGPIHHVPRNGPPIIVGWGEKESRQYKNQGQDFVAAWRTAGGRAEPLEIPGYNHLEVPLDLGDANTPLAQAARAMMRR